MRALLLSIALTCAAAAHDLYLIPGAFTPHRGETITIGFHVGDSFPNSEVGGRLDKLRDPLLWWKTGKAGIGNLRVESTRDAGDVVAPGAGDLIASVWTVPTLIELDPAKFTKYLTHEGLAEAVAWRESHGEAARPGKERFSKYAKLLMRSGEADGFFRGPVGHVIEIFAERNPAELKPGSELPIQVMFRGKPAADLQIETAWAGPGKVAMRIAGRTGPDGRLMVPLPAAGMWRIHTIKMERCAEPAVADWESFWASLTFQLR